MIPVKNDSMAIPSTFLYVNFQCLQGQATRLYTVFIVENGYSNGNEIKIR